jgi:dihydrofolate reductase
MRKIINSTYVTLDGVVENPHLWPKLPLGDAAEHEEVQFELLEQCDILLLGRRTYDVFAPAWTSRSGDAFADRINSMRKVVASTTLTDPTWTNTEVVASGLAGRVRDLKSEPGGDIIQYGVGPVTHVLLDEGLLDELRLWVYPQFVRGSTADLLFDPEVEATFDLTASRVLSNGIVVLQYSVHAASESAGPDRSRQRH